MLAVCLMTFTGPLPAREPLVPVPRPQASPPPPIARSPADPRRRSEIRIQALPDLERLCQLRSDGGLYTLAGGSPRDGP